MVGDFGHVLLLPCHCGAFGRPHTFCRRMKQVNLAIVLQQAGLVGLLVCAVGAFRYVVLVERPEDRTAVVCTAHAVKQHMIDINRA